MTPFNASLICHRNANEFDMEKGFLKSVERPALVVVPTGKIGLQISLDVMLHSKSGTQVHHPEGESLPVNALAVLAEVVGLTHLEEVYEPVRGLYDSQAGLHVKGGLQRNPSEYVLLVKRLQCCQTVIRRSGIAFPFAGKRFIKAGQREPGPSCPLAKP